MFLLAIGVFSSSFLTGGSIGILSRHRNMTIGDGLVPMIVGPISCVSTVTTVSLIVGNPTNMVFGVGIVGFVAGNFVTS
jgi:hypothetical protein